jgi:uncharacterized pyridoxal phosphate-containing UPF0001 family protein
VDCTKFAEKLNKEVEKLIPEPLPETFRQPVLVQVYSGDEDTKHGVKPDSELMDLIGFILTKCPRLEFKGIMSMGKLHDIDGFQVSKH